VEGRGRELYRMTALSLASSGAALSIYAYFVVGSIPLTATGIGALILGISMLLTPLEPIPSPQILELIARSSENVGALLELLNVKARAYYVPIGGRVYALVPLGPADPGARAPNDLRGVDGFIVHYNGESFIALAPPYYTPIEPIDSAAAVEALQGALNDVLVERLEICESLSISISDSITIMLRGVRSPEPPERFRRVMGSLESSIAASIAAMVMGRPVRVASEDKRGTDKIVRLEVF